MADFAKDFSIRYEKRLDDAMKLIPDIPADESGAIGCHKKDGTSQHIFQAIRVDLSDKDQVLPDGVDVWEGYLRCDRNMEWATDSEQSFVALHGDWLVRGPANNTWCVMGDDMFKMVFEVKL